MAQGNRRGARGPEWRGDEGFGGGWGNQVPRPHRRVEEGWRGQPDDPHAGEDWYGPAASPSNYGYGGPGFDGAFGAPRFDHDIGRAGGQGPYSVAAPTNFAYGMGARDVFAGSAREYALRHDPHYADWRHRQTAEFDRDYDEYRRENQGRFDREFGEWRTRRGEQRAAVGRVREHMEVVGSDGAHVGTVDCTRGDRIVLTKNDESADGIHHWIPCDWIDRVEDKLILNLDADEARRRWESENHSRALFERERSGAHGPHVLNRSFAGTYRDRE
jgi:hypothetical protein